MNDSCGPEIAYRASPRDASKGKLASLDDAGLVARALAGNDMAHEVLMDRYVPLVLGFFSGKVRSLEDAEDLSQEVFCSAFRFLGRLRTRERFGPWVMRIAKNRLVNYYRFASRRPVLVTVSRDENDGSGPTIEDAPDPGASPPDRLSNAETANAVREEIARLGERYRIILHLRLIGEETAEDIALRLNLRPVTVRQRLFRGMKTLRRRLKRRGIDMEH